MTKQDAPSVITTCPSCGNPLGCSTLRDPCGLLHPMIAVTYLFNAHENCDWDRIIQALRYSAYHLSKVTVYKIRGEDDERP